ncbi:cellulose biosynthesis protein BcsQ [Altererythrobacter atlanticus]|uniref:Sporulation initiation inhibitor protein Soj n=1 Tax=Croceibacterium atlanticum TaxID=1267766 RepID=A0A0F7KVI1_9SPHN|nr:ParA family protein [Croceibacterium atlanticum]AKH42765.1 Sporulation initiation inhibitor protein Soj [Croceibacterium atlanticum]MBB5731546.1 cellulose biosynthesis protein BcsQ [Croceibacterium atlanticum]
MAVIAVYSVKGGVGKTTISTNLAWCSAIISCRKTLLWDLDASGGAGFLLGVDPGKKASAQSVFSRDAEPGKLVRKTGFPRLDLLPADDSLRDLDSLLSRIGKRKRLMKLTESLSGRYGRIILDCPPVLNEISAQVVRAADCIIVPLPPSPLSSRAFEVVVKEITRHAKTHPPILPVISMLDRRRTLHRLAREENPGWPAIPQASVVEQCAVRRQPVGAFSPQSPAARNFAQLWTAIERKLNANGQ